MARLTTCRDCGATVSKKAATCPRCGRLLSKPAKQYGCFSGCLMVGLVVFVAIIGLSIFDGGNNRPAVNPAPEPPVTIAPAANPAAPEPLGTNAPAVNPALDSALTIDIIGVNGSLQLGDTHMFYRVRNTSRVTLHHLTITHIYRDSKGGLIATESGWAINPHIQPGAISTVKVLTNPPSIRGSFYFDVQATSNKKEVKISKKD